MTVINRTTAKANAATIKNETVAKNNTALRVGGHHANIADSVPFLASHPDAATRAAATMAADDVGTIFKQVDDGSQWFCYQAGTPGLFWKIGDLPALKCATDVDVALTGNTTPDGVTLTNGDPYLAGGQTVAKDCGVYVFNSAGAHPRHPAFSVGAQFKPGLMTIASGTKSGLFASYAGPANPVVGTDAILFTISSSGAQSFLFQGGTGGTDTTGVATIPVGHYKRIRRRGCGSGGSGGSGRKGATNAIACGGGGGSGSGIFDAEFDYALSIAAGFLTDSYIVGGSVNGAAGQTTDTTDGIDGTDGRDTTVTIGGVQLLLGSGGAKGLKGTATTGTGGSGSGSMQNGGAGGSASTTGGVGTAAAALAFNTVNACAPSGGGAGGGVTSGNVANNGGKGGIQQAGYVGGWGGNAGIANGADAVAPLTAFSLTMGGVGGSGGGGGLSTRGTDGSAGAKWGGGGGGGGGARDGQSRSGAGGASGPGFYALDVW